MRFENLVRTYRTHHISHPASAASAVNARSPLRGLLRRAKATRSEAVPAEERRLFSLSDDEVLKLERDRREDRDRRPARLLHQAFQRGVGCIAAAFYPKPVIVRTSDFKTNEYAQLLGGREFEPEEENPMLGFRGASRYYDERYAEGFALECRALARVRGEMGLTNVKVMIPFCRTIDEAKRVIASMSANGLKQGENGLEVYCMCELPANVALADEFLKIFDGYSIGSNDLTQLVLGLDRDSGTGRTSSMSAIQL